MLGVNQPCSYTDPLDFYTMPRSVTSVCEILHRLWCSIGAPDSVPLTVGFTALTWRDFYIHHIECAYELSTLAEQIMWLDLAANYFCQFLLVAETQFKQYIYSTQPQSATLVTVASWADKRRRASQRPYPHEDRKRDCGDVLRRPDVLIQSCESLLR